MSLSGAEDDSLNAEFVEGLRGNCPDLADHYYITSDSVGTIVTALEKGEMNLQLLS